MNLFFSFFAALIISLLSGMGVGGGGLFVIYLSLFTDTPQLAAQGMNLLFFLLSAGASMTVHLRRRQIYALAIGIMAAAGVVGSLLGTLTSEHVSQEWLRKTFGTMLVISGILALKKKKTSDQTESLPPVK